MTEPVTEGTTIHHSAGQWLRQFLQDGRRKAGLRRAIRNRNNTMMGQTLQLIEDRQSIGVRYLIALAWFARWDRDMRGPQYEVRDLGTEPHPTAEVARDWMASNLQYTDFILYQEAFASTAISGNETAAEHSDTLRKLLSGQPVTDMRILGLAWSIRDMREQQEQNNDR